MEKFKRKIEKRIKFYIGVIGLFTLLFAANVLHWFTPMVENQHYTDFFNGVQFGMLIGVELFLVYKISYYQRVLKNDNKLKMLYIEENDERTIEIAKRTGIESYKVMIMLLLAGAIIIGYFSMAGFIAFMVAALLEILVRLGLYSYYSKTL